MTRSRFLAAAGFTMVGGVALLLLGLTMAPSAPTTSPAAQLVQSVDDPSSSSDEPKDEGASKASYSDAELRSFAEAAMEVKHIKEIYIPQIAASDDEQEQEKLKEAATREMTQAVEKRGLKVDRYQEILAAALTQPELAHRVGKYMSQPRAWV